MTVALTGNATKSAMVKSTNIVFIITHHLSNSCIEISLKQLRTDNYGKSSRLTHHLSQTEASLSLITDLFLAPSDVSRPLQSTPLSNVTSAVSADLIWIFIYMPCNFGNKTFLRVLISLTTNHTPETEIGPVFSSRFFKKRFHPVR